MPQEESKTTKDAEALAALCNVGKFDTLTISKIKAALTAEYERGKADVVPSGDARELARKLAKNLSDVIGGYEHALDPAEIIQRVFDARDAAARAEGERIEFERAVQEKNHEQ